MASGREKLIWDRRRQESGQWGVWCQNLLSLFHTFTFAHPMLFSGQTGTHCCKLLLHSKHLFHSSQALMILRRKGAKKRERVRKMVIRVMMVHEGSLRFARREDDTPVIFFAYRRWVYSHTVYHQRQTAAHVTPVLSFFFFFFFFIIIIIIIPPLLLFPSPSNALSLNCSHCRSLDRWKCLFEHTCCVMQQGNENDDDDDDDAVVLFTRSSLLLCLMAFKCHMKQLHSKREEVCPKKKSPAKDFSYASRHKISGRDYISCTFASVAASSSSRFPLLFFSILFLRSVTAWKANSCRVKERGKRRGISSEKTLCKRRRSRGTFSLLFPSCESHKWQSSL